MTDQAAAEHCPGRDDGTHCVHWWDDAGPCCGCGDDTRAPDVARLPPELADAGYIDEQTLAALNARTRPPRRRHWLRELFLRRGRAAGGTIPERAPDPDTVPVLLSPGAYYPAVRGEVTLPPNAIPINDGRGWAIMPDDTAPPDGPHASPPKFIDVGWIEEDGLTRDAEVHEAEMAFGGWGARVTVTMPRGWGRTTAGRATLRLLYGKRVRARHLRTKRERRRAMHTAYHRRHTRNRRRGR